MSFSPIKTQVDSLEGDLRQRVPFIAFTYLTVTFPSTPDTDLYIAHPLTPPDPENIDYEVVKRDRACVVYNDQSGTRIKWGAGFIVLRCDTADAVVELRLTVRRT